MEQKFENLYMYLAYKKNIEGESKETTVFRLAQSIEKTISAFYRKLRDKTFSKAEKLAIYTQINKQLASEKVIQDFFTVAEIKADVNL